MATLVIADHDNETIAAVSAKCVTAAGQLGMPVHVLIAGAGCADAAKNAASFTGVDKVLVCDDTRYAHGLPEPLAELVLSLAPNYEAILAPATASGRSALPRVAARLDVPQISDVIAVESPTVFRRPIYAGNAVQRVEASGFMRVMTVRTTAFKAAAQTGTAPIEAVAPAADPNLSRFVSEKLSKSERPDLTAARIVVSGGRGVGSKGNFALIERLADSFGAAVGASRAAVDAGYISNDYQVGQTGKAVAPELYVAVGISGAIQHLAGMKNSKIVVAINKDENAPIFSVADYGLVGDLFEIVPELEHALGKGGT